MEIWIFSDPNFSDLCGSRLDPESFAIPYLYLTCPHHPELNGIAKYNYKQIIDMGLTLLACASMPTIYLVETFNTAVS